MFLFLKFIHAMVAIFTVVLGAALEIKKAYEAYGALTASL